MQRRVAVGPAVVALVALVLAACTSGDAAEDDGHAVRPIEDSAPDPDDTGDDTPDADLDDTPDLDDAGEPPDDLESDEPEDPFAVPDEIDDAYVDLVMNELLAVDSAVLRDVLSREPGQELEEADAARIRAVFAGPQLVHVGENYFRYATDAEAREVFFPGDVIGDARWQTRRVPEASTTCIVTIGYYDLTDVSRSPYPEGHHVLASLSPRASDDEAEEHTSAPWRIHDLNPLIDADDSPIPEADWHRINYDDVLETTCE